MKVLVRVFDRMKDEPDAKIFRELTYTVDGYGVMTISADRILKESDESNLDELDEYLILLLSDGSVNTFGNSRVECFVVNY